MYGDGGDPELATGANDADGNFTAIGDQDFFEHAVALDENQPFFTLNSFCPNSTLVPFCTSTSSTVPATSLSISFMSFMASTMHKVCPTEIAVPTSVKTSASGEGER